MKITAAGFHNGYNALTTQGDQSKMNMDFDVLSMNRGNAFQYKGAKEAICVLVTGKVTNAVSEHAWVAQPYARFFPEI